MALVVIVTLSLGGTALAQEADADSAKTALEQGIQQFVDLDFKEAKATLLGIDRDKLDEDDQEILDEYIIKSDEGLKAQLADMEAFNDAESAQKDERWDDAREGYAQAAASEFLPEPIRKDAKAQLALVEERAKAAGNGAAETPANKPADEPAVADLPAPADQADEPAESTVGIAQTSTIMERAELNRRLQQELVTREFDKSMAQAEAFLNAANDQASFNSARDAVRAAQNAVESKKTFMTAEQYRNFRTRSDTMLAEITEREDAWNIRNVEIQVATIEADRKVQAAARDEARRADIENRVDAAKLMIKQHDYEGASKAIEGILNIDPRNRWALDVQSIVHQIFIMRKEGQLNNLRIRQEQNALVNIRETEIPWDEIVRYPDSWLTITKSRERFTPMSAAESEGDRAARLLLQRPLMAVDFQEQPLEKVIQWLRDVTNANLTVNWADLEMAGVTRDNPITLHLRNVRFETVLKQLLELAGGSGALSYVIEDGVITVATLDKLREKTVVRTYDINDLIVRVPNFMGPELNLDTATSGSNNGGSTGGTDNDPWSTNNTNATGEDNVPSKSEMIQQIITMISTNVEPDSWRDNGGTTGSVTEIQGQLIITQTQENHAKIAELISRLREAQAMQINIEARFISVSSGFLESIGLNLDVYFNLGGGTIVDPQTGAVIGPNSPNWVGKSGNNKWSPMGVTSGGNSMAFANTTNMGTGVGSSVSGPSLSIGGSFLDDVQVNFLIQATQASAYTRTLVAPRLTIFNGQRAYVAVMTQQAYIANYTPTVSENVGILTPDVNILSTGTVLDVEGTISADRRYVTMTVRPTVTTLDRLVDAPVTNLTGAGTFTTFISLPLVSISTLETTVSVPDRGTLLLGGQRMASQIEREQGVPLLSKIPVVNRLFTNRGMVRDEQTLLILIKPTIIIHRESEEEAFPALANQ